jgi:hypothetical protein
VGPKMPIVTIARTKIWLGKLLGGWSQHEGPQGRRDDMDDLEPTEHGLCIKEALMQRARGVFRRQ